MFQKSETSKVYFNAGSRRFVIEYNIFEIDSLQCVHVEFAQKIGVFSSQFTMYNMDSHAALAVMRKVVSETESRYSSSDLVIFTSLDGNKKRISLYDRMAKNIVKRQHCDLETGKFQQSKGHYFILHRGCYSDHLQNKLYRILSEKGFLILGGSRVAAVYALAHTLGDNIMEYLPFS